MTFIAMKAQARIFLSTSDFTSTKFNHDTSWRCIGMRIYLKLAPQNFVVVSFDLRFRAVSVFHMRLCLSGLPLEILAQEFWVPNSTLRAEHPKFQQKEIFQEILTCTDDTACLYALRACQDRVYSTCCPVFFLKLDSCCRAPHPFLFAGLCTPCQPRSFNQGEGRGWPRIS